MTRKRLFDYKLYLNGLSQLKIPGFIVLAITLVGDILFILNAQYGQIHQITALDISPLLIPFMYLAPVLFVLYLFSFLNKRNSADFYHSIPDKRAAVFLSFTAAVLTWVIAIIIIVVFISTWVFNETNNFINLSFIGDMLSTYIAGSILVIGAALIAACLTGTVASNIILTYMILLLPRIISSMFMTVLISSVPTVPIDSYGFLFDPNYDIAFRFLEYLTMNGNVKYNSLLSFTGGAVFTAVIGIAFIALAGLLFVKRKSETAGKSAPSRGWQHVFRCALVLPISLMIPKDLINLNYSEKLYGLIGLPISQRMINYLIILFFALIIYFLYELITTRKAINMLKAVPALLIVLALNGIFVLSFFGVRGYLLNKTIDPQDIASVSNSRRIFKENSPLYTDMKLSEAKYTNYNIKKLYSEALKASNEFIKKGKWPIDDTSGSLIKDTVVFHLKNGREITRVLYINASQTNTILSDSTFTNALRAVPDDKDIRRINFRIALNKENTFRVYDQFRKELKTMKKDDIVKILCDGYDSNKNAFNDIPVGALPDNLGTFQAEGYYKGSRFINYYQLTSLTPKTERLYMDLLYQENIKDLKANSNKILSRKCHNYQMELQFYNSKDASPRFSYTSNNIKKDTPALNLLQSADLKSPAGCNAYAYIKINAIEQNKTIISEFYIGMDEPFGSRLMNSINK